MLVASLLFLILVEPVYLNGRGPYRFFVDTGAEVTALHPSVAERLGLRPEFRTEIVTVAGAEYKPGARVRSVASGAAAAGNLEVVFDPLPAARAVDASIEGMLGQDFLSRQNYLIDYHRRRVVFGVVVTGPRAPLLRVDGLPAVEARVAGRRLRLVLDSGVEQLVLFREAAGAARGSVRVTTNSGAREARAGRIGPLAIGGATLGEMDAVFILGVAREAEGLLPLRALGSVYINNAEGYVVVKPREVKPGEDR